MKILCRPNCYHTYYNRTNHRIANSTIHQLCGFLKSFDSIVHEVLWNILRQHGLPAKIIKIIKLLYENFKCQVIHGGTTTNSFAVTTGARQGCILSPLLFLVVVDWVGKTAFNDPKGIGRIFTTSLEDLFADDICTLAHRLQDI